MDEMLRSGAVTVATLNRGAGFVMHPLDLAGAAVLVSAGRRVAGVWRPAVPGAVADIVVRTLGHALFT
ncbi:MAG: hypothetical protein IPM89_03525 [Candidatus Competibacteraceae bacterium]|nr:MAG: hypothetical protein IPM89_03525 [Candidatus Competibacteraceae bacterium]